MSSIQGLSVSLNLASIFTEAGEDEPHKTRIQQLVHALSPHICNTNNSFGFRVQNEGRKESV
jgi:hypothetical protein